VDEDEIEEKEEANHSQDGSEIHQLDLNEKVCLFSKKKDYFYFVCERFSSAIVRANISKRKLRKLIF
jgi:hypothetical protein